MTWQELLANWAVDYKWWSLKCVSEHDSEPWFRNWDETTDSFVWSDEEDLASIMTLKEAQQWLVAAIREYPHDTFTLVGCP